MLEEIFIENLAVIEKASVGFTEGLNVFTGETGAGKSILINGINALLGQRVTKDIVRTGEKKAVISGCFSGLNADCLAKLEELGLETEDGKLYLSREIRSDGGSTARINSRSINVSALREIGSMLVTIHGQHDNQILMSPERHIDILDSYSDAQPLLDEYGELFRRLQELSREINRRKKEQAGKAQRLVQLKEIIEELTELDPKPDEDTEIDRELEVSKNAVFLTEAAFAAERLLAGDEDTDGADSLLGMAEKQLLGGSDIMPEFSQLYDRLTSAKIEIADIASELDRLVDKLGADPQRFEWLNSRSRDLDKAKMKYGPTLDDVIMTLEKAQFEFDELNGGEESLEGLAEQQRELLKETSLKAAELSAFRKKSAERFVKQVTEELEFLNMPKVRIVVDIRQGKLTHSGMDTVEFLISANVGEEPRPIAKIASGGELSRIMLALKSVIADKDGIGTLIFDEIDTGVSGRAAQKIGMKLKSLSKCSQVICVTHLSQMAVMADTHLLIEKKVVDDRTRTTIRPLDLEERKFEIARIIGGDTITELTLQNAEELIRESSKL
ncbi:DNA repair protein RecN (Recombination protein N) [Ruminococcus sp. YE71]|uniref:DNA repair protein RecN n=1 Tax=unclassified Ruminococcus TaxID=2608920 RepID=UPI00088FFE48|nr:MULTISPECIES: DNA repair protein RecN [unclassified Ruminococcus]SDA16985.1 DNA repair protein RecN (Recombination protein N) [Ruminococcus sp. YE78]SFW25895.1 DNA repair protein RecN (Recombination protein N) [Ruminococcus sp. YE71]